MADNNGDGMIMPSDEEDDSSMLSDESVSSMDDGTDDDGADDDSDNESDDGTGDDGAAENMDDAPFEDKSMTPLVRAIELKEPVDVIRAILRRSPELAQRTVCGLYPLSHAVLRGSPVEVVRALYRCWPESVRVRDPLGFLPLNSVNKSTPVESVEFLVDVYPAALHEMSSGSLPIHDSTVWRASKAVVRVLVEGSPESPLVANGTGRLPIHLAADPMGEQLLDVIEFLADQRPETLLVTTPCGNLPVHLALLTRWGVHVAVIQRLTVKPIPEETRLGLMHFMVREVERIKLARSQDLDRSNVPEYLLKNTDALAEALPATLRAKDSAGSLPIHVAVAQTHPSPELVQLLADGWNGALDVRDAKGRVPLQLAHANPTAPLDVIYSLVRARPDVLRSGFS